MGSVPPCLVSVRFILPQGWQLADESPLGLSACPALTPRLDESSSCVCLGKRGRPHPQDPPPPPAASGLPVESAGPGHKSRALWATSHEPTRVEEVPPP